MPQVNRTSSHRNFRPVILAPNFPEARPNIETALVLPIFLARTLALALWLSHGYRGNLGDYQQCVSRL